MSPIETPGYTLWRKPQASAAIHAGFALAGVITTLLGPVLPIFIARWSLSDQRAGLFFTLQFCGNLAGVASLGPLISKRGYRFALSLGFTFVAAGVAALNFGFELVALLGTAAFGYGLGLVLSTANLWVAEDAPSRRAAALSVLNLLWGLGALACPGLVLLAVRAGRLPLLLLCLAGLSAAFGLFLASLDLEPRPQTSADAVPSAGGALGNMGTFLALGSLFFLYVGTESSIGGWAAAFASRTGARPGAFWELAPMFFWAGLLSGRALAPLILRRVAERALLPAALALAGVCNAALVRAGTFPAVALCLVATGLGLACVYPLLIARMVGQYGQRSQGARSILFALASLGGATLPWLVGFTSSHTGSLRAGLFLPLAACLVMLGLQGLLRDARAA